MTPTRSTAELLREAKAVIDKPQKWCKGYSLTPHGRRCAVGALNEVADRYTTSHPWNLRDELLDVLEEHAGEYVPDFNDEHSHADVMALFDRAIAAQEANPS